MATMNSSVDESPAILGGSVSLSFFLLRKKKKIDCIKQIPSFHLIPNFDYKKLNFYGSNIIMDNKKSKVEITHFS